jgi:hypothetical protein
LVAHRRKTLQKRRRGGALHDADAPFAVPNLN